MTTDPAQTKTAGSRIGVVTSDKADKTRKVQLDRLAKHPKYGKFLRRRTILHVHDEENLSRLGDEVEIVQCRPMSKSKRWRVVRIVTKGHGHEA
ncbi:MAG: 30S ribosomal protein S17 [Phycisphaerales bacterium JB038]